MPKPVSKFVKTEQPMNWKRAFFSGATSAAFMMAFIDIFYLMGITPFTFESYLGSLFEFVRYTDYTWTLGFFINLVIGGVFGFLYAYFFEYVFSRANARIGIWLGVGHSLIAALAFFPFFGAIHEFLNVGLYPHFGFLGSALGAPTLILLVTGHMLYGACMGLFYGDVRIARVRARFFEPGEVANVQDPDLITDEEDHPERIAV